MASEKKVFNIIKEAGFEPIEDKGIIVKYAPENLSAKIAQFFSLEYYVLQLCKSELIFLPFSTITAGLKREIASLLHNSDSICQRRSIELSHFHHNRHRHHHFVYTTKRIKRFPLSRLFDIWGLNCVKLAQKKF